jgi:hypothetical protein
MDAEFSPDLREVARVRSLRRRRKTVKSIRVFIEFQDAATDARLMRWERRASAESSLFELLGRAFEAAQREKPCTMGESLAPFLHGAMLQKQNPIDTISEIG